MHPLVLRKKLVSYFASTKRSVTIIYINYENILQLMTDNTIFVNVKKMTINFQNLFDTAIGLRMLKMAF